MTFNSIGFSITRPMRTRKSGSWITSRLASSANPRWNELPAIRKSGQKSNFTWPRTNLTFRAMRRRNTSSCKTDGADLEKMTTARPDGQPRDAGADWKLRSLWHDRSRECRSRCQALDTRLNRFVAIKLLAPVYSTNGSSRRRFEREGRAIASVKDPNVIPVHTVGEYRGTPYIVMQYVPDGSLQQRIEKLGPLETSEVVCVGMQVARGLAAAHKRGIVHRDVKPANVLLESGVDCAMVTDFGLARVVDEATMTRSGAISGTPQYMSPEQAKGESVDPRSDLFSLGSVMYAACTGHSPFRAESVFGVIKRVCDSEPRPIREVNPDIPQWLSAFISKLHSKRVEDRFESADEVASLLSQELAHLQAPTMVSQSARDWWKQPMAPIKVNPKPVVKPRDVHGNQRAIQRVVVAAAGITLGVLVLLGIGRFDFNGPSETPVPHASLEGPNKWDSLLALTKQENENLPRFKNSVATTLDVKSGGLLLLQTNRGALDVVTHDKPTVEMKLVHTVSATDQETANRLFQAMEIKYELDSDDARGASLAKGKDAVIVATFPTRKLTQKEIEESNDLEELKEQLLIRYNSHFRNAEFELRIPRKFNLNLETSAGPIQVSNIDGSAKCLTHGGHIETGNITGKADLVTEGGHISTGDLGAQANLRTKGGHISTGNVQGELIAKTDGGHIHAEDIAGLVDVETNGGEIELGHASAAVKARSLGGGIKIWKADGSVQADAPAGSIVINFTHQPNGETKLNSSAGSIRIGYVDGLSFDIHASSAIGRIAAPFVENKGTKTLHYEMNGGQAKLTATAVTGNVRFHPIELSELDAEYDEMLNDSRGQRAFQLAYDTQMAGRIDRAMELHKLAAEFENYKGIATYNLGCAWALKGNKENAFAALNDAITFGFDDVGQFQSDKDLNSLRQDERFDEIIARLTQPVGQETKGKQ